MVCNALFVAALHRRPPATKALHTICVNNTSIDPSSWWWGHKCPKHIEQIISAINHSVASSCVSVQECLLIIGRRIFGLHHRPIRNFDLTYCRLLQWCSDGLRSSRILSTADWLPTFRDYLSVSVLLDCLTLKNGKKDCPDASVNQLPTFTVSNPTIT